MAEHYWANKAFRSEGALRGARRWSLPPSLALRLVAALLLAVSLALAWWNSILQSQAKQPRPDIYIQDLFVDVGAERGGHPRPPPTPPPTARYLLLVLHPPDVADPFPRHDVELLEGHTGRILWSGRDVPPRDFGTFNVGVPRDFLPGGRSTVRLYGVERSGRRTLLASYPMELPAAQEGRGAVR